MLHIRNCVLSASVTRYFVFGKSVSSISLVWSTFVRDSTVMSAMKMRKPEPAEIEYKGMRFLITYRPTDATMDKFVEVSFFFKFYSEELIRRESQKCFKKVLEFSSFLKACFTSLFCTILEYSSRVKALIFNHLSTHYCSTPCLHFQISYVEYSHCAMH